MSFTSQQASHPNMTQPCRQTICGIGELTTHREAGVTHMLSILDPGMPDPEPIALYPRHDRLVLRFHDIIEPLPGFVAPERDHVEALLTFGRASTATAEVHVLVHCHMGVSRSTAAMTALLLQRQPDMTEEAALAEVARLRPQAWPNSRMIAFADELLGRNGRLIEALGRFYGVQLRRSPGLEQVWQEVGRAAEVEMAK